MLEILLGILGSGGFGAAIGAVAGMVTKVIDNRRKRDEDAHRLEVRRLEIQEGAAERAHELAMADKAMDRADSEGRIAVDIAEAQAFAASIASQNRPTTPIVETIRAMVRVVLTLATSAYFLWLLSRLSDIVGGLDSLDPQYLADLYRYMVESLAFMAMTYGGWYFATRPSHQPKPPR